MEMVTEAEEIVMKELRALLMKGVANLVAGVILLLPPLLTHISLPTVVPSLCYRY